MAELRYAYRSIDDAGAMLAAVRAAGLDAEDESDVDGVVRLVVRGDVDRERVRELLRTARPQAQQRHSLLFEDELSGGA